MLVLFFFLSCSVLFVLATGSTFATGVSDFVSFHIPVAVFSLTAAQSAVVSCLVLVGHQSSDLHTTNVS